MDLDKIISLSKELRRLKNKTSLILSEQRLHQKTNSLLIPKFPFTKKYLYPRTAPWIFNGFVVNLGNHTIIIDPGADFLTRCLLSDINLLEADILFVSHAHLDHYASAEIAIEAMTYKQGQEEVHFIAPGPVYEEKRISDYHSNINGNGLPTVKPYIIHKGKDIVIDDIVLHPVELFHSGGETFGCILTYKNLKIGYISDTGYTKKFVTDNGTIIDAGEDDYQGSFVSIKEKHEKIAKGYKDVDILLCCLNDYIFTKHSKYHMTGYDLIDLLNKSRVKKCIVLHFNQFDLTNNRFLRSVGLQIEQLTKIPTVSVFPKGLTLHLSEYF